ncbi:hypothetical protein LRAMOSA08635 [Lichtheimia ramosa]|uniref:Uncharacterized protein n=1 Tax=Lichtheimia ramosa TaxID=688394 RepID=A0A077WHL1_9FUNG|nr:hypothetical protein LRAMOSA08635 [Lichtheimia ramosa]
MDRCSTCPNAEHHELHHQESTTLRYNALGGWTESVTRDGDGQFHCLCGQYQSQRPDDIRNHARTCQNVSQPQQPSSSRSQRIARRSAVAPYPPRSKQSSKQVGVSFAQTSGSSTSLHDPIQPPAEEVQVAHIRELLVQVITSNDRTVENFPEDDVLITFDVRLAGIRAPALRGALDIARHGANVDTLAGMVYSVMNSIPGGTIQNLRIHPML